MAAIIGCEKKENKSTHREELQTFSLILSLTVP
jgi:hypothetical protein